MLSEELWQQKDAKLTKDLKEIKNYTEFCDWWHEFKKTVKGDRRTKKFKNDLYNLMKEKEKEWEAKRDLALFEKIQWKNIDSDIASIKIMQKNNSFILLNTGSDGISNYAILNDSDDVPSKYKLLPIVLAGVYKIMSYDCFKTFDEDGEIIEGDYIRIYVDDRYNYIFIK